MQIAITPVIFNSYNTTVITLHTDDTIMASRTKAIEIVHYNYKCVNIISNLQNWSSVSQQSNIKVLSTEMVF